MKNIKIISVLFAFCFIAACSNQSKEPTKADVDSTKTDKNAYNSDSIFQAMVDADSIADISVQQNESLENTNNKNSKPFSEKQLNFMINEFTKDCKNTASKVDGTVGETIKISLSGEGKYYYYIHPFYDSKFCGDFDKDGNKEIIFTTDESGGGTHAWQVIYCLKEKKDGSFKLTRLEHPCPCPSDSFYEDEHIFLIDAIDNNIIIELGCKKLGSCGADPPFLLYHITYKYRNDSLIPISKKKIDY